MFAVQRAEEKQEGRFAQQYLSAPFRCHINRQNPAGGKLITGFGKTREKL